MRTSHKIVLLLLLTVASACAKKDGMIEGTVIPPNIGAKITALQSEKPVSAVDAGALDGKFKLSLPAGIYAITITVPGSPYPLHLNDVAVKSGETTVLPPIELAPPAGKASLSINVIPPLPGTEIKLIYEGKERAAAHVDQEGKYEFKELPAGTYEMRANAPGHADDVAQVIIGDNQKVEQNAVLLPIVSLNGVDWGTGKIRATGFGLPPQNAANNSVRREMAKRAALADAQRNMLRIIEQIRINADQDVKAAMRSTTIASKIQGFIKGYTVVGERELEGGKVEVTLELPLTGPAGLARYITE